VADGSPSLFAILAELVVRISIEDVDDFTLEMARAYHEFCRVSTHEVSAQTAILHARARILRGDLDFAEAILDDAEAYLRSHRYPLHAAGVSEVRGLLAVARGDIAKASKLFELGTTLYGDAENMSDRARCTRLWSSALLATGERLAVAMSGRGTVIADCGILDRSPAAWATAAGADRGVRSGSGSASPCASVSLSQSALWSVRMAVAEASGLPPTL